MIEMTPLILSEDNERIVKKNFQVRIPNCTLFENYSKCLIGILHFSLYPPIFVYLSKMDKKFENMYIQFFLLKIKIFLAITLTWT